MTILVLVDLCTGCEVHTAWTTTSKCKFNSFSATKRLQCTAVHVYALDCSIFWSTVPVDWDGYWFCFAVSGGWQHLSKGTFTSRIDKGYSLHTCAFSYVARQYPVLLMSFLTLWCTMHFGRLLNREMVLFPVWSYWSVTLMEGEMEKESW